SKRKRSSLKAGGKHKEHLVPTPFRQSFTVKHFCLSEVQDNSRALHTLSTTGSSPITESFASLSTYNDQSVTFVMEEGSYEIYVEDLGKDQEKGKVLLHYYESSYSSESGDAVDGKMLMVTLSPAKDFWLHANNKEHSVELHKCKNPLPDQAFFVL
ncbi:interleukin-33-like, partial [Carlito syrichta]|uniref:Interleukin-33 n=1 Tax=Carlito syrichta TaxID=1868482 RepID=A0A1U7TC10_CARSF